MVEADKVRDWVFGTTGAVSVSFAFQMPGRENETRRRPNQWLAHLSILQDSDPDGAQGMVGRKRAAAAVP